MSFVEQPQIGNPKKTRRAPIDQQVEAILNKVGESTGVHFVVVSGGQNAETGYTGSVRHDDGGAADVMAYTIDPSGKKQYLDFSTPAGQKQWQQIATLAFANGANGIGAAEGYMGSQEMHIGTGTNPANHGRGPTPKTDLVWGADGKASGAPAWLVAAKDAGIAQRGHPVPPANVGAPVQVAQAPSVPPAIGYAPTPAQAPGNAAIDAAAGTPGKLVTIPPVVPAAVNRPGAGVQTRDTPPTLVTAPTLDAGGAANGAQPVRGTVQVAPTTAFNGANATAVANARPGNSGVIKTVPQAGNVAMPAGARPSSVPLPVTAFDGSMANALLTATTRPTGGDVKSTTGHVTNVLAHPVGNDVKDSHGAPANVQVVPTTNAIAQPAVATPALPAANDAVKQLQTFLTGAGFNTGAADGIAGPRTLSAIRSFQASHGLTVDGVVGPQTLAALQAASSTPAVGMAAPVPAAQPAAIAASNNKPSTNALAAPAAGTPVQLASGTMSTVGAMGTAQGGAYQYVVQPDGSVLNVTTGAVSAPAGFAYSKGSNALNGDNGVPGNSGNWFNQVTGRA